jgi:hypothetical protein
MKKLILTLTIAAFALTSATFAEEAKKECPLAAAKKQCAATGDKKMCCSAKQGACTSEGVSKQALLTPKASK